MASSHESLVWLFSVNRFRRYLLYLTRRGGRPETVTGSAGIGGNDPSPPASSPSSSVTGKSSVATDDTSLTSSDVEEAAD